MNISQIKLLKQNVLEIRKAYFLKAFNREQEEMAIISFAGCNWNCPYCKRGCQYIDSDGNVIKQNTLKVSDLLKLIDEEVGKGRRIRLSGGDPSVFPKESLMIGKYVMEKYGKKISFAHNGSNLKFVEKMLPYIDYIAIDFKAFDKEKLQSISGVKNPKMQQKEILNFCRDNNILVDIRTPIFGDTKLNELKSIANVIAEYKNVFWSLRKYNKVQGCDFKACDIEYVSELARKIKALYKDIKIGSRNYWKGGFEFYE